MNCPSMQSVAAERSAPSTGSTLLKNWSARTIVALLVLTALWFLLCKQLSGEWSVNEQYHFGWFVPFFGLYLFWLRWQDRLEPSSLFSTLLRWILIGVPAFLPLFPFRLFHFGTPYSRLSCFFRTAFVAPTT